MWIRFLLSAQWAALSLPGPSFFQSFEATGSKSALIHYEEPTFFVSGETICCVVSGLANNRFSVFRGTQICAHTHTTPTLCHLEDNWALGNKYFWKIQWWHPRKKIHVQLENFIQLHLLFFFSCPPADSFKLAWKSFSVAVINLRLSRSCLFGNQMNYMILF